jgi:hypothetical protein
MERSLFWNTKTSNENIYCDANGKIPSSLNIFLHETLTISPFSGEEK